MPKTNWQDSANSDTPVPLWKEDADAELPTRVSGTVCADDILKLARNPVTKALMISKHIAVPCAAANEN